jgi:hypothetical protein
LAKKKTFALSPDRIRPIATGRGACIASDEITVMGKRVGYAYRERPDHDTDSGWRFFSGEEPDGYADDPDNFSVYDVNTIANYDPQIIAILAARVGAAFARDGDHLVKVEEGEPPQFVSGEHRMTEDWSIALPTGDFQRRIEEGSLVLWRPGLTAWIDVYGATRSLASVREVMSADAFDVREDARTLTYRLRESNDAFSLYGFVVGRSGYVQLAVYFDREADLETARATAAAPRSSAERDAARTRLTSW